MSQTPRILFCNCAYAQVVPGEVKGQVLRRLCDSGIAFEAVPDLCEAAARRDSLLIDLAKGQVKIAACFPRAVKWLFSAAGVPLAVAETEVLNMRVDSAESVVEALLRPEVCPNLPGGPTVRPPEEESVPGIAATP